MSVIRETKIKIDDPLGYPERDVLARLRHMARDAIDGTHMEFVESEADTFIARLRQAGKLPSAERK